jgi:hypothetical protein
MGVAERAWLSLEKLLIATAVPQIKKPGQMSQARIKRRIYRQRRMSPPFIIQLGHL